MGQRVPEEPAELPGELMGSASFSRQQGVTVLKKHCPPGKLPQALVSRASAGASHIGCSTCTAGLSYSVSPWRSG